MFGHIAKGFTVGQHMLRSALRLFLSKPWRLLDKAIAFCWPSWDENNENKWENWGGGRVGPIEFIPRIIVDSIGYLLGGLVGGAIGLICFIPDTLLRIFGLVYTILSDMFNWLSSSSSIPLLGITVPTLYIHKVWNISILTLGMILGAGLGIVGFFVGICLAGEPKVAVPFAYMGMILGGVIGSAVGIVIAPVVYLWDGLTQAYDGFRGLIRNAIASIYAQFDERPMNGEDTCCGHSLAFSDDVQRYRAPLVLVQIQQGLRLERPLVRDHAQLEPVRANHPPGGPAFNVSQEQDVPRNNPRAM